MEYSLSAVHEEMGEEKSYGMFHTMKEAEMFVVNQENWGTWPVGFEAILKHEETGTEYMYTGDLGAPFGWEELDYGAPQE